MNDKNTNVQRFVWCAALLILSVAVTFAENTGERFYQSIRNNDLATLRTLIKEHGAVTADSRGQTPLMIAAAFGSYDAMKLLIDGGADVKAMSASGLTALHLCAGDIKKVRLLLDHGADVNVRSQMGRTPLLVAAYTNGASETVKLLLSKGADVNTSDATGLTPLIAAASVNDALTAKLLLDHAANINPRANIAFAATALMAAAHNGNGELTRLFLTKSASVSPTSAAGAGIVKNGVVQFGSATALHFAVSGGNPEVVKLLLDAGARVDAQDMRGMTPLTWGVSTDRPNRDIIRMLLQKASDPSVRSKAGESALDWAREFNHPAILTELRLGSGRDGSSNPPAKRTNLTPRNAVERAMPLLKTSAVRMLNDGGCVACHAQPLTHIAVMLAQNRGWTVDDGFLAESLQIIRTRWINADQPLLQGQEGGGQPDIVLYSGMSLAAAGEPASWNTDVLVYYLLAKQRAEGNWHGVGASRAPIQDGDLSRTALSIRALAVYGMPGRRPEIDASIERAAKWLAAQIPLSTEDRVMQLLGLKWANGNSRFRESRIHELIAEQRSDGGWAQTPYLSNDAYATGQVLYALHSLGAPSTDQAFQRGVEFLLYTQQDDGSWYVKSRAMKIQPYFESGFPHGHDQWISSAATAWAVMALSLSAPDRPSVATVLPVR
jgi:ankyrin repeat protein